MKIRLEVGRTQRAPFEWFARAARRHPSFKLEKDGDVELAILEFANWSDFLPYFQQVTGRSKVAIYQDDRLVPYEDVWKRIYAERGFDEFGNPLKKPRHDTIIDAEVVPRPAGELQ